LRPEPVEREPGVERASWLASLGSTRPAVYVTFGTERAAADAPWRALLEAIGHREVDALVTTGAHADIGAFGQAPGNVRVERYVPQGQVLGRVAAVVSHAGAGTMLGAASAGVPQVVVPIFADQWENADAISSAGAALVCEEDERTAAALGSALDSVVADAQCRTAAASVALEMSLMPTAADLVPALEAAAPV
jgi:MGT family glycosyltransferase